MGFLPCLRRGSDRWWLPRSMEATEAIGLLMIAEGRGVGLDSATRMQVLRTLQNDPPLMIFAALNWVGDQADPMELVDWLAEHVTGRFASGDALLGAPTMTPAIQTRWRKLRDHFRTVPFEAWLEDAALWLEVTGPQVSRGWREQWPTIATANQHPSESHLASEGHLASEKLNATVGCMLQQLARVVQRERSLETAFGRSLHKSKLGSLKQLAYGLSHEINNPLANISTRAQQLQRGEEDPGRSATLQRIIDQVYRAHEMIADLMFFANPPPPQPGPCSVESVLRSVADSFREEVERQAIRLEVTAPDARLELTADVDMIAEAVRALVRNAIDAIGCEGTIVVSLEHEPHRVLVHVADSGPGLSDHARQHAFDPYFSGREAGRGLGLGLCRAYRIAKLHHGDIALAGGPTGCVATISLPI